MTDTHARLLDYAESRLSDEEAAEFEEHVKSCAACREQLALIRILNESSGFVDEDVLPGHPSAEEIVGFATDSNDLDSMAIEIIGQHVGECERCRDFLSFIQGIQKSRDGELLFQEPRMEASGETGDPNVDAATAAAAAINSVFHKKAPKKKFFLRRLSRRTYMIIAIAILVLFYLVFFFWTVSNERQSPKVALIGGDLTVESYDALDVRGSKASASTGASFTLNRSFLHIVIETSEYRNAVAGDHRFSIEIRDSDGKYFASSSGRFSSLKDPADSRRIQLLLPTPKTPPGKYTLSMYDLDRFTLIFVDSFLVER